jgi:hypothetical protein
MKIRPPGAPTQPGPAPRARAAPQQGRSSLLMAAEGRTHRARGAIGPKTLCKRRSAKRPGRPPNHPPHQPQARPRNRKPTAAARPPGGVGKLCLQPSSRRPSRPTPLGRRELGPLARAGVPPPASVHAGQMQGVGHTSGKYGRLRDQPPRDEGRPARGGPGTRVHAQGLRGVAPPRWIEAQDPTQPDPHLRGTARYPAFKREEPGERGPGASAAPTTTVPPITS